MLVSKAAGLSAVAQLCWMLTKANQITTTTATTTTATTPKIDQDTCSIQNMLILCTVGVTCTGCKKHGVHLSKKSYFVCGTSMSSCLLIQKTSKHLGHNSSAHFWTSDKPCLFFQFFPACPKDN